jgi:3-vinyl bacteriochlorophyllide hydratase
MGETNEAIGSGAHGNAAGAHRAAAIRLGGAALVHRQAQRTSSPRSLWARANDLIDAIAPCPWQASAGSSSLATMSRWHIADNDKPHAAKPAPAPLYTPEERERRDTTIWTPVQAILAPLQFLVFLVSVSLIARTLMTGEGYELAVASVVIKTLVLYTIMITGSIWEKAVFGKWLFARSFFWEDVFSMLVLALHTAYLIAIVFHIGDATSQLWLALAAYAAYVMNAGQFLWKLRQARLESPPATQGKPHHAEAA